MVEKYLRGSLGINHAKKLIEDGCGILDIGGEATNPGSKDVSINEEWKRISSTLLEIKNFKKFISLIQEKVR